jgi:hypothetical protein
MRITRIILLLLMPYFSFAQEDKMMVSTKYNILFNLCKYGPQTETKYFPVDFIYPATSNFEAVVAYNIAKDFYAGINFGFQQFDLGYELVAHSSNQGVGLSGGGLVPVGYLLTAGFTFQKNIELNNRYLLMINTNFYYAHPVYREDYLDTNINNSYYWNYPRFSNAPWHIRYPPYISSRKILLNKTGIELGYKFKTNWVLSAGLNIQFGGKPFTIDTTSIEIPATSIKEKFYSATNGNAAMLSFGLSYYFK